MMSIVVPAFNEQETIPILYERVLKSSTDWPDSDFELIIVDDGSTDNTFSICEELARRDGRVKVVSLSRNFGHQAAVTAGLDHATGDIVAVLDADLQDPPEVLGPFIQKVLEGCDVVYAIRTKRKESLWKRASYYSFYRLLGWMSSIDIPTDSGDFCVMSRRALEAIRSLRERSRFIRGLRRWVGFHQVGLSYERDARVAGSPKYDSARLVKLALDGIINFSSRPLQLSMVLGVVVGVFSLVLAGFVFVQYVFNWTIYTFNPRQARGWTSLILVILFSSATQLFCLGILGEYVGRIFEEVKRRPVYLVSRRINMNCGAAQDGDESSALGRRDEAAGER